MQNVLEQSAKMLEMDHQRDHDDNDRHVDRSANPETGRRPISNLAAYNPSPGNRMAPNDDEGLCLFLKGLPFMVTENEVWDFFSGINVDSVFLLKHRNGANNGKGLVKFATREDALEGLKRDKEYIGSRYIEITPTTMDDWLRTTGRPLPTRNMNQEFERGRSPVFNRRCSQERVRSRSPVGQRHPARSDDEYCVHVDNLSFTAEKEHIKQLFHSANLEDDQILQLNDSVGRRTRAAFVLFKNRHDFCDALALENTLFHNRSLSIRPISREHMISLLESQCMAVRPPGNAERIQERTMSHPGDFFDSESFCVFVRNLPFDVRKIEILDFFHGYNITEDEVCVLHDHTGAGVGKALILFGSEAEAMRALSLNGQRFLGSEVILKSISRSQMQQLLAEPLTGPDLPPQDQRFLGRSGDTFFHQGDSGYLNEVPLDDNIPMRNVQGQGHGGFDYEPGVMPSGSPNDGGNRFCHGFDSPVRNVDMPVCVQLQNLPFQIKTHEIYDFCYGYSIVPGSALLQYDPMGRPTGSATLLFQSHQEALTAIKELSGRPIGPRKIHLMLA